MSSIVTRTAAGSKLQSTLFAGLPFDMVTNTTLNEHFGIQSGVAPAADQVPAVGYYCIGNGGHSIQTGASGKPVIKTIPHLPRHAGLYSYLPFVLRAVGSDIDTATQANYALRKIITVNGSQYIAYYLKRIPTGAAVVSTNLVTVNNGTPTSTAFVPSAADLAPTPPDLSNAGVNVLQSQYITCTAPLPMSLTAAECQELINACVILFGDASEAMISEVGICSGVDKSVVLAGGGSFLEAIAVQIVSFVGAFNDVYYSSTGVNGTFDLGSQDPMLTLL